MDGNYEILLNSEKSKESLPTNNALTISLDGNRKTIDELDVNYVLDLNEQYNKERDECTKYRLIITLNPYCTNILCNPTSTIISPILNSAGVVTDSKLIINSSKPSGEGLDQTEMTRWIYNPYEKDKNTKKCSLRNPPLKYRIGYDIFDNVYFRTNSIRNGKFMDDIVPVSIPSAASSDVGGVDRNSVSEYAYVMDEINGYTESITKNLSETNGWLQCLNPSKLLRWEKDTNGRYVKKLECVIPYSEGGNCEKTDMFPTREMFQFDTICRYENDYLINEENWEYCLTYPYKNIYDHWLVYSPITTQNNKATLGIPIIFVTHFMVGLPENIFDKDCFKVETAYPNKLKKYDKIRIYTSRKDKETQSENVNEMDFIVQKIVNDTTFYILATNNINIDFFGSINNIVNPRLRRIVDGIPCDYYIRQFRKIPNWKFENEKITENNINKKLQTNNLLFSNSKYRLAYSKNNFDDKLIQITFTDSIDINLLQDNLGRPLSEIYLTIIKNNESLKIKKWEPQKFKGGGFKPSGVNYETEFQRYWSKNSVGFELVDISSNGVNNLMFSSGNPNVSAYRGNYPNIYCMHNVEYDSVIDGIPGEIRVNYNQNFHCGPPNDIIKDPFDWPYPPNSLDVIENKNKITYYGDICEFDKSNFKETILSRCQHRFNTVNRESKDLHDTAIVIHGIALFNTDNISVINSKPTSEYEPLTGDNTFESSNRINGMVNTGGECERIGNNGNMIWRGVLQAGPRPEGYYHQAHYPIKLKWYENMIRQKSFPRIYLTDNYYKEECITDNREKITYITLFSNKPHKLLQNSIVKVFWELNRIEYEKSFFVNVNSKDSYKISIAFDKELFDFMNETNGNIRKITMYQYDYDTPLWAKFIGNGRFVWRNILSPSELTNDPTKDFPFTNGNFYVHEQINFFLRRQSIGCPSMLFTRTPSDVSPSLHNVSTEIFDNPPEDC